MCRPELYLPASGVDSRTIIDMNGAEKLLGKGDMLFYPRVPQSPSGPGRLCVRCRGSGAGSGFDRAGMVAEYNPRWRAGLFAVHGRRKQPERLGMSTLSRLPGLSLKRTRHPSACSERMFKIDFQPGCADYGPRSAGGVGRKKEPSPGR